MLAPHLNISISSILAYMYKDNMLLNSNFIDEMYAITVVYYLVCNSTSNEYAVGGLVYC